MNKNLFVGTWKLNSCELKDENGTITYPLGQDPIGYIMYNEDGYMSVAMMRKDRPKFSSDDFFAGTTAEKAKAFEDYVSYCGTYEILEDKIIHHPEVMYIPNFVNVPQERYFEFDGNKLILGAHSSPCEGKQQSSRLVWEKV